MIESLERRTAATPPWRQRSGFGWRNSFTIHAQRALSEIARDIEINWLTFSERLHLNALEEDLAKALARTNDPEVKRLARTWLLSRRDVLPKVEP